MVLKIPRSTHSRFFTGGTDRLGGAFAPVSGPPFTMATWFTASGTSSAYGLMFLGNDTEINNYWSLVAAGSAGGDPIWALTQGTTSALANTSTGFSASTWHHAAAVFGPGDAFRAAYLDGGGKGTNTTSRAVSVAPDSFAVGSYRRDVSQGQFVHEGAIWMPCVWGEALNDGEIKRLALGAHPYTIRPHAIRAFWPFGGWAGFDTGNEIDVIRRYELVEAGTVTLSSVNALVQAEPPIEFDFITTGGAAAPEPPTGLDDMNLNRGFQRGADRGFLRGVA